MLHELGYGRLTIFALVKKHTISTVRLQTRSCNIVSEFKLLKSLATTSAASRLSYAPAAKPRWKILCSVLIAGAIVPEEKGQHNTNLCSLCLRLQVWSLGKQRQR